jgi:hypothetical protein
MKKTIDLSAVPDEDLKREWARRNSFKRKTKAGGRPVIKERCPCGIMTLRRAESRKHVCEKINAK